MFKAIQISVLIFMLAIVHAAQAANVTATRVWPANEYTRLTIEADQPITHTMLVLKNPDRIVLDLKGTAANQVLKELATKVSANDPYIQQIRVAKFQSDVTRVVVDLKTEAKPSLAALLPAAEYKYRLVLDIYPMQDPLMAMLDKHITEKSPTNPVDSTKSPSEVTKTEPKAAEGTGIIFEPLPEIEPEADVAQGPLLSDETLVDMVKADSKTSPPTDNTANKPLEKALPIDKKADARLITIAIDAGHGGEDSGAKGANGSHEKDITLAIAKKLKAQIDAEPNMRGVLTRDDDYFIPLHGRVVKARKMQADLFLSIHADAFTNRNARGSSVFALSEKGATSASARYLAKKENESDLIGGVSLNVKDPILARTLLDLSQTATINDSLKLGKAVLGEVGTINKLHKSRVEQAGFAVLKSPDIPSILVETAFISNPDEEAKLNDEAYQEKMAATILTGIKKYFASNPALAKK